MDVNVNYLSVFVAAVISTIVGFLWYSPILFGKQWTKLMNYSPEALKNAQKKMSKMYLLSFVFSLIMAYMLYHVMVLSTNYFGYGIFQTAFSSALSMWVGFILPVQVTDILFQNKPLKLLLINTFYQLSSLLAMGIAIAIASIYL